MFRNGPGRLTPYLTLPYAHDWLKISGQDKFKQWATDIWDECQWEQLPLMIVVGPAHYLSHHDRRAIITPWFMKDKRHGEHYFPALRETMLFQIALRMVSDFRSCIYIRFKT